jgi:hypothetical protein
VTIGHDNDDDSNNNNNNNNNNLKQTYANVYILLLKYGTTNINSNSTFYLEEYILKQMLNMITLSVYDTDTFIAVVCNSRTNH